jgi:hypothetical protein
VKCREWRALAASSDARAAAKEVSREKVILDATSSLLLKPMTDRLKGYWAAPQPPEGAL